jgi:alcohol dehydrogenase, propanol-preferring
MKAVQYRRPGGGPELTSIDVPEPGAGQILVKITAAGLCHSDLSLMGMPAGRTGYRLPMTLGHEGVGTVAATGDGVSDVSVGEDVAAYLIWGCGRCPNCVQGRENYCLRMAEHGKVGPGLGWDGTLAEYLLVDDARHLVPLKGLDPVQAVPLTDAGLTPYHAVKRALPRLLPGSTAVVIGVGGLGHMAVQLLLAMTAARVVALDVSAEKLALAARLGAHHAIVSDDGSAATVRDLTDGSGARVVFDFVGAKSTLAAATRMVAVDGEICIVGMGSGDVRVGFGRLPFAVSVSVPFAGTRSDLVEVIELARLGAVTAHVQMFGMDEVSHAYDLLREGKIEGRAVVVP